MDEVRALAGRQLLAIPPAPRADGRREAGRRGVDGPCTRRGPPTTIEVERLTARRATDRPCRPPRRSSRGHPMRPRVSPRFLLESCCPSSLARRPPTTRRRTSTEGKKLLAEGDALADKGETTEAVIRYKRAFEQLLPGMRKTPVQARGEARRHRARGHEGHAHQGDRLRDDPRRVPGQRARHEGAGTPARATST